MKYYVALFLTIFLAGCNQTESQYYWQNPRKLKQALSACPMKSPKGLNCNKLSIIALKFKKTGNELKRNPQLFGLRIIEQQEKIAKIQQVLNRRNDPKLANELKQARLSLAQYLAVVSYYESPQGGKDEDFGE